MADLVTSQTLFSGTRKLIKSFTSVSDGTGESAVQKVDISGLESAPTRVAINRIWYDIAGMAVKILFDRTVTDETVLVLAGDGEFDFSSFGGLKDPASAAGTGDILFTTLNHSANDTYTIILELVF